MNSATWLHHTNFVRRLPQHTTRLHQPQQQPGGCCRTKSRTHLLLELPHVLFGLLMRRLQLLQLFTQCRQVHLGLLQLLHLCPHLLSISSLLLQLLACGQQVLELPKLVLQCRQVCCSLPQLLDLLPQLLSLQGDPLQLLVLLIQQLTLSSLEAGQRKGGVGHILCLASVHRTMEPSNNTHSLHYKSLTFC